MHNLKLRSASIAILFLTMSVSSCGGSGSTTTVSAAPDSLEFNLVAGQPTEGFEDLAPTSSHGFGLADGEISAPGPELTAHVGDEVTLTVENLHPFQEQHNFVVLADFEGSFGDAVWDARISALDAGESGAVTFIPDTAGTYFYVCTVASHRFRGMSGEFKVEP